VGVLRRPSPPSLALLILPLPQKKNLRFGLISSVGPNRRKNPLQFGLTDETEIRSPYRDSSLNNYYYSVVWTDFILQGNTKLSPVGGKKRGSTTVRQRHRRWPTRTNVGFVSRMDLSSLRVTTTQRWVTGWPSWKPWSCRNWPKNTDPFPKLDTRKKQAQPDLFLLTRRNRSLLGSDDLAFRSHEL
jgi:hypothetical protein